MDEKKCLSNVKGKIQMILNFKTFLRNEFINKQIKIHIDTHSLSLARYVPYVESRLSGIVQEKKSLSAREHPLTSGIKIN